jgi:hypothetical protein
MATAVSSTVPVDVPAQHRIYSAATAVNTLAGIVADVGSNLVTATIYGTISYGTATTVPATLTLDLTQGMIDFANANNVVTIQGTLIAPSGKRIFTNYGTSTTAVLFTNNRMLAALHPGWWGIVPDGVTNNDQAFFCLLRAAGTMPQPLVQLAGGTYVFNTLDLRASNLMLRGQGMYVTTLFQATGANADALKNLTTGLVNITLENLTVDANGANQSGTVSAIAFQLVTNPIVRNVRVLNARARALYFFRCNNVTATDNVIINAGLINGATSAGIQITGGTPSVIARNHIETVGGVGDHIQGYGIGVFPNTSPAEPTDYGIIAENYITGTTGIGIATSSSNTLTISANNINTCAGNGIDIGRSTDVTIQGNIITACFGGIVADPGGSAGKAIRHVVTGNIVRNCSGTQPGIGMWGQAVVSNNLLIAHAYDAITIYDGDNFVIVGNIIKNTVAQSGIVLFTSAAGKSVTGGIIANNRIYDDQGSPTQTYGIQFFNTAGGTLDQITVVNNDLRTGGTVANFAPASGPGSAPSALTVRNNKGYVTENSGTGTIASGATSAVVTHGLTKTPVAADIAITFTENPTNAPGHTWISAITSTQFTVNVRVDPGASNLDFSWQAFVH